MENENKVGTDVTTEKTGATEATETKKSFEELLQDKDYQSAFDKKIAQSLQTAKVKWQEEMEAKNTEAEKLAKMKSDEKLQYQLDKANKEKEDAQARLNAYELKEEAVKIASEKGLDVSLLDLIDFKTSTAESINISIDNLTTVFNKAVEKAVNDRLKEDTPTSKVGGSGSQPKAIPTIF